MTNVERLDAWIENERKAGLQSWSLTMGDEPVDVEAAAGAVLAMVEYEGA